MPRPFRVLLVALVLAAAHSAGATTLTSIQPTLRTDINNALTALPSTGLSKEQKKQKAALTKALVTMDHDDAALEGSLAGAVKVAGALDPALASNGAMMLDLDALIASVQGSVGARNGTLLSRLEQFGDADKARKKAAAAATSASTALTVAQAPETARPARAKALAKAMKSVLKGEKALAGSMKPGGATVRTTTFDMLVGVETVHVDAAGFTVGYSAVEPANVRFQVTATIGGVEKQFEFVLREPGRGVRKTLPSTILRDVLPGGDPPLPLQSGTVTVTSWKPEDHQLAATFELTFGDGNTTVTMTKGKVSTTSMTTTP